MSYNFDFDSVDLKSLANKYGTPLYVMDEVAIRKNIRTVKENFQDRYERARVYYASKAFLTVGMVKMLVEEGIGIDVVSGGELFIALKGGMSPEKIMFHGNNKGISELEEALMSNVGFIVVDGLDELKLLVNLTEKHQCSTRILLRISPLIESATHDFIATGQLDSKFGIPLDSPLLIEAIQLAKASTFIEFKGLHIHLGSQLMDNKAHLAAAEKMMVLLKTLKERHQIQVPVLNFGGGFGVGMMRDEMTPAIATFTEPMMALIEACAERLELERPEIMIEPGRSIVASTGITLYTIGNIKDIPGVRKYVSVDGGMTDNIRSALYNADYDAVAVGKLSQTPIETITLAGRNCESGDVLIKDIEMPALERGDVIAVLNTGAYNYSMSSNYNKVLRPAIVMVNNGVERLSVKRETYEDLLRNDLE